MTAMVISFEDEDIVLDSVEALYKLHDSLWHRMDALLKEYNPCEFKENSCYTYEHKLCNKPYCCSGCVHISDTGCAIQSLTCKYHLCGIMMNHRQNNNALLPEKFINKYFELKCIANMVFISAMREPREYMVKYSWRKGPGLRIGDRYNGETY